MGDEPYRRQVEIRISSLMRENAMLRRSMEDMRAPAAVAPVVPRVEALAHAEEDVQRTLAVNEYCSRMMIESLREEIAIAKRTFASFMPTTGDLSFSMSQHASESFTTRKKLGMCSLPSEDAYFPFFSIPTIKSALEAETSLRSCLADLFSIEDAERIHSLIMDGPGKTCSFSTRSSTAVIDEPARALLDAFDISFHVPGRICVNASGTEFYDNYARGISFVPPIRNCAVLWKLEDRASAAAASAAAASAAAASAAAASAAAASAAPAPAPAPAPAARPPEEARVSHEGRICGFCTSEFAGGAHKSMMAQQSLVAWYASVVRLLDPDPVMALALADMADVGRDGAFVVSIDIRSACATPSGAEVGLLIRCIQAGEESTVPPGTAFCVFPLHGCIVFVLVEMVRPSGRALPIGSEKVALATMLCVQHAYEQTFGAHRMPPAVILSRANKDLFMACASAFPICANSIRRAILDARRKRSVATYFWFSNTDRGKVESSRHVISPAPR
jgi:hypothetical protein